MINVVATIFLLKLIKIETKMVRGTMHDDAFILFGYLHSSEENSCVKLNL